MNDEDAEGLFAWKVITDEIAFRRDKRWKIFSWAGAIHVLIMGGIIALTTDPQRLVLFPIQLKLSVIIGVSIITFFSIAWIWQNLAVERKAIEHLKEYNELLAMKSVSLKSPMFGYIHALVLLYIGTCISVFL